MTAGHRLTRVDCRAGGLVNVCQCGWESPHRDELALHLRDMPILEDLVAWREIQRSWWNWTIQRERSEMDAEYRRAERAAEREAA